MDNPNLIDAVAEASEIGGEEAALSSELDEAQRDAATPLSESWGEALAAGMALEKKESDEARLKYRSAVRRAVESIWVLILPGRGLRIAAAQVWFKSGAHRDYLIGYRVGVANKKSGATKTESWSRSFAESGLKDGLDLRTPSDAVLLERVLLRALPAMTGKQS